MTAVAWIILGAMIVPPLVVAAITVVALVDPAFWWGR